MFIQERKDFISLPCKGADNKALWPWAPAGLITGPLLSRALCTSGLNRFILLQQWHLPLATSAWPQHSKYLWEAPQYLSARERGRMCQGEDVYSGNTEATGKVCVYPGSTQDLPAVGYPWREGTEEVKDNWTPWFLWINWITQPSLTSQGLFPLLSGALHYQWCQTGMAPIQVHICWHFPTSEQGHILSQLFLYLAVLLSVTSKEQKLSNSLHVSVSQVHVKSLNIQQHIDSHCWVLDVILQLKSK